MHVAEGYSTISTRHRWKGQMASEFPSSVPSIFPHKPPPLRTELLSIKRPWTWLLNLSFLLPWGKITSTNRQTDGILASSNYYHLMMIGSLEFHHTQWHTVFFFFPQQRCATYQNLKGNKNISSPSCCSSGTCRLYLLNTAEQQRGFNRPLPEPLFLCDHALLLWQCPRQHGHTLTNTHTK